MAVVRVPEEQRVVDAEAAVTAFLAVHGIN